MHTNRTAARNILYNVLATGFMYPEEHVCDWLFKGKWQEWMNGALHALGMPEAVRYCTIHKLFPNPDRAANCLDMAREYTRLFINGVPRVVAPPYGSVYMDHAGLYGSSTPQVARFYQKAGFALAEDLLDLPDHISHELEFLGILTAQEAEAREGSQNTSETLALQGEFLERFMFPWIPHFCGLVRKFSKVPLYAHLAEITQQFLILEKSTLDGQPEFRGFSQKKMNQVEVNNGRIFC